MASERKFVKENLRRVLLKEYLMKNTERAGFGGLNIQRTPIGTRITLTVERPGMVIGRKGTAIKDLTDVVENRFGFDNPQIEVEEAPNPNLNAQIMAQKLATTLERGWHFRRAGHSTVKRIMDAGARGCQVTISGKLTGQRHRSEKFKEGHIKYSGEPSITCIEHGFAVAKKKLGVIGLKVMIMLPTVRLPDEISINFNSIIGQSKGEPVPTVQSPVVQVSGPAIQTSAAQATAATVTIPVAETQAPPEPQVKDTKNMEVK